MPGSPVPTIENELIPWLTNFGSKLGNYLTTLALQPSEITQTQGDVNYIIYLLNERLPSARQTLAATVEYKNLMMFGDAALPLPIPLPGSIAPPAYPATLVAPGVIVRLRKFVQNIKTRSGYTDTIGQDLDIITSGSASHPDAPTLALVTATAGAVSINWNKGGWTGVKVQSRIGTGPWADLGIDLFSPFVDLRPLMVPNQAEGREYRAAYLDGDTVQPNFSQTVSATVTP